MLAHGRTSPWSHVDPGVGGGGELGAHMTSETLRLLFTMFHVITSNGSTDYLKA